MDKTRLDVCEDAKDDIYYFLPDHEDKCFSECFFGIALYQNENNNYIHKGIVGELSDAIRWLKDQKLDNIISVYDETGEIRYAKGIKT